VGIFWESSHFYAVGLSDVGMDIQRFSEKMVRRTRKLKQIE
jgi:hypothetical protein